MKKKIVLRPITYDDTDLIVKWRNQEDVKKYFIYRETLTPQIHKKWMDEKVSTGQVVQFIICDDNNVSIGSTYLRDIDKEKKEAEYGVFIGETNRRGEGIGTEALRDTLRIAFEKLGLEKVIARSLDDNKASIATFLHSGFEVTDNIIQYTSDGLKLDVTLMAITKEKYENTINSTSV